MRFIILFLAFFATTAQATSIAPTRPDAINLKQAANFATRVCIGYVLDSNHQYRVDRMQYYVEIRPNTYQMRDANHVSVTIRFDRRTGAMNARQCHVTFDNIAPNTAHQRPYSRECDVINSWKNTINTAGYTPFRGQRETTRYHHSNNTQFTSRHSIRWDAGYRRLTLSFFEPKRQ